MRKWNRRSSIGTSRHAVFATALAARGLASINAISPISAPVLCGLDHVITKPHVHLPFQYHVHLVTLVAFTEKDIARRELHRVSFLTKKFCRIHKWRLVDKPSV